MERKGIVKLQRLKMLLLFVRLNRDVMHISEHFSKIFVYDNVIDWT